MPRSSHHNAVKICKSIPVAHVTACWCQKPVPMLFTMFGCARLLTDSLIIACCIMALVLYYDAQRFVGMVCSQCSLSAMYDTTSRVAHSTLHRHISTAFLPARKHVLRHTKSCHRHTAGLLPQTSLLSHTVDTGLHFVRPWTFSGHFSYWSHQDLGT